MMTKNRKRTVAMAAAGLAVGVTAASAQIINTDQDIIEFTPASVVLGDEESDTQLIAFDERQCFTLGATLQTDQGELLEGTEVSCHLVHGDAVVSFAQLQGRVRFDNQIVGV